MRTAVGWGLFKSFLPPEHAAAMLSSVPEPVRLAYHDEWQPTYAP